MKIEIMFANFESISLNMSLKNVCYIFSCLL